MVFKLAFQSQGKDEYDGKRGHVVQWLAKFLDAEGKMEKVFRVRCKDDKPIDAKPGDVFNCDATDFFVNFNGSVTLRGDLVKLGK